MTADILLWVGIVVYIGLIYSTLSLVPIVRKSLIEWFGYDVFDWILVLFGICGAAIVIHGFRTFRGMALARYFIYLGIVSSLFVWYLLRLPYAIERIHLFEYGLLGLLFCIALRRYLPSFVAYGMALIATYMVGLGDEAIQGVLPSRVGEIRDAFTNLVSGGFGVCIYAVSFESERRDSALRLRHVRLLTAMVGAAALGSGLFLVAIQGFGHMIRDADVAFYSTFTASRLDSIAQSGVFRNRAEEKTFYNEASRHLFQRDFYYTNDFLAKDGSYYRDWRRALGENAILEKWYRPFLEKYRDQAARAFSGTVDRRVGEALGTTPVAWPDSIRHMVAQRAGDGGHCVTSRVKSTVITAFSLRHLLAAEVLTMAALAIAWIAVKRASHPQGR